MLFQKVDAKKLQKAEAKLQQKAGKQSLYQCSTPAVPLKTNAATASQVG